MNRSHYEPSACKMFRNDLAHQLLSLGVEIGAGLIEQPKTGAEQRQAGERNAPLLPCRKRAYRPIPPILRAYPIESAIHIGGRTTT